MAQNSGKRARGGGRPFEAGQSGNPGGRPKGLGRLVREKTRDGATIYTYLWKLARGASDERTQLEALKLLAAYGYGTPGAAQVEWDEERVRALAVSHGRDGDEAVKNFRLIRSA